MRALSTGGWAWWRVSGAGGVGVYRAGAWVGEHRAGASFTLPLSPAWGQVAG